MKRPVLLDMLQRRHELAMACVARQHLDTADQPRHSDGQDASTDSSVREYEHMSQEGVQDACMDAKPNPHPASFAMQPTEVFKQWVERLCGSLPVVHRSRQYQARVLQQGGASRVEVSAQPQHRCPEQQRDLVQRKLVLPGTNRVAYQPNLPYVQFVAAVGIQLLVQASKSKDTGLPKKGVLVECMLAIEVLPCFLPCCYCYCGCG